MSNVSIEPKCGGKGNKKGWAEAKPWVRRLVAAAEVGEGGRGEKLMGWWCVEMEQFLGIACDLPIESPLKSTLEG
jgi:hypothetical protein